MRRVLHALGLTKCQLRQAVVAALKLGRQRRAVRGLKLGAVADEPRVHLRHIGAQLAKQRARILVDAAFVKRRMRGRGSDQAFRRGLEIGSRRRVESHAQALIGTQVAGAGDARLARRARHARELWGAIVLAAE